MNTNKVTCYKCQGKPDPRFKCEPCSGTGYLSDMFTEEIKHTIKDYIDLSLPQAIATI